MKNEVTIYLRFMRDPLPTRLGGIATDLARLSSSARHSTGRTAVSTLLEESRYFIEWTAADVLAVDPDLAVELVDLQLLLAAWQHAWNEAGNQPRQRNLLSMLAKKWSDQVLGYSQNLEKTSIPLDK